MLQPINDWIMQRAGIIHLGFVFAVNVVLVILLVVLVVFGVAIVSCVRRTLSICNSCGDNIWHTVKGRGGSVVATVIAVDVFEVVVLVVVVFVVF